MAISLLAPSGGHKREDETPLPFPFISLLLWSSFSPRSVAPLPLSFPFPHGYFLHHLLPPTLLIIRLGFGFIKLNMKNVYSLCLLHKHWYDYTFV